MSLAVAAFRPPLVAVPAQTLGRGGAWATESQDLARYDPDPVAGRDAGQVARIAADEVCCVISTPARTSELPVRTALLALSQMRSRHIRRRALLPVVARCVQALLHRPQTPRSSLGGNGAAFFAGPTRRAFGRQTAGRRKVVAGMAACRSAIGYRGGEKFSFALGHLAVQTVRLSVCRAYGISQGQAASSVCDSLEPFVRRSQICRTDWFH